MIDSHAHISLCEGEPVEVIARAIEEGVAKILTVGLDEESNADALALADRYEPVFAAVGRHPNSAEGFDDSAAEAIGELAASDSVVAIGETGLDYFRDGAPREDQRRAFELQIEIARKTALPLIIHMRSGEGEENDAVDECFRTLAEKAEGLAVILHCFSAHPERVAEAAARNWYCSFAGNVTYPKSELLREAAALVPDDLILVETDSPFLAPQGYRGKSNQPARVVETATVVAIARGESPIEFERLVERNAATVFGW